MPHKPNPYRTTPAKSEQARLLFLQGASSGGGLVNLDPKPEPFLEALLLLLNEGVTVHLKPGSGGRCVGIGGWAGEERLPWQWLYDDEEVDAWASKVIENLRPKNEQAAD